MSDDPDWDPFADEASPAEFTGGEPVGDNEERTEVAENNEISVTFKAHGGFDAPWVVARGSADYLAQLMGIKEFDGRLSTLMKSVAKVDDFYKGQISGGSTPKG